MGGRMRIMTVLTIIHFFTNIAFCTLSQVEETKIDYATQEKLLNDAFQTNSDSSLSEFFENWEVINKPISHKTYNSLNKIEKETYDVINTFYSCENKYVTQWKLPKFEYYVLHYNNKIVVSITDSIYYYTEDAKRDSFIFSILKIKSETDESFKNEDYTNSDGTLTPWSYWKFTDPIQCPYSTNKIINSYSFSYPEFWTDGTKVLYLTEEFNEIFKRFFFPIGSARKEPNDIHNFLYQKIGVSSSIRDNIGFSFPNAPSIGGITFDKDYSLAKMKFFVDNRTGVMLFKKTEEGWIIWYSTILWTLDF
jgi:hypothetical protein